MRAAVDRAARLGYRVAWRGLRLWWCLRRPTCRGAAVAVVENGSLLLVRPSYREEWGLPGGLVDRAESAAPAAARELHEETAIMVSADALTPLGEIAFERFGARFEVALFLWRPPVRPVVTVDGREIRAASWAGREALSGPGLGPDVGLLLERHSDRLFMV